MDSSIVNKLLLRWQELRRQKRDVTPEEICADHPELLDEFRRRLEEFTSAGSEWLTQDAGLAGRSLTLKGEAGRTSPKHRNLPTVPGYEILEELGRGGMGVVYKARDVRLKRLVALKMIRGGEEANPDQITRFRAEAEAVARLQHPNIVQIYEIGECGGLPFFSLEYVSGGSLKSYLGGQPQAPREAASLVCTLARAMQVAHLAGIIHRDLKPSNILLVQHGNANSEETSPAATGTSHSGSVTSGAGAGLPTMIPKVSDFGVAKQLDDSEARTITGALMGTPSYMAPEQANGHARQIGPATDVYALGAVLYEMLTGRPPLRGATTWQTLELVRTQEPVSPRDLQPGVPRDLETICLKCLSKEPGRRYPSAADLADDLQRFLNREPVRARPVGNVERLWRWCQRNPAQALLSFGGAVAFVGLLALGGWFTVQLAAADARAHKAKVDQENAEIREKLEEMRRQEAEKLAATHAFYRWFNGAREKRSAQEAGWTWRNLAELEAVLRDFPDGKKVPEVRTEVVATLSSIDARLRREAAPDFKAGAVAFTPDGKSLVLGQERVPAFGAFGDCAVLLVDPETGKLQRKLGFPVSQAWQLNTAKPDGSRGIAISPDGAWLAIGTRSGWIHRWNLREADPKVHSWRAHGREVHQLAFDRSSTALFSVAGDESICRWRIANATLDRCYKADRLADNFSYDPIHQQIAVAGGGACILLDAEHLFEVRKIPNYRWGSVVHAANGQMLIFERGRTVEFLDLLQEVQPRILSLPHQQITHEGSIRSLAISPCETLLAVASMETRHVQVWDLVSGRLAVDLATENGRFELAFSPDCRTLAVTGDNATWLYEIRIPQEFTRHALQSRRVDDLMLSGDGRVFACRDMAEFDAGYTLWPVPDLLVPQVNKPLRTFRQSGHFARQSALSHDGSCIAFRSYDQLIHWTKFSKASIHRPGSQDLIAWAPDQRLWTVENSLVRVWKTPELLKEATWDNSFSNLVTGRGTVTSLAPGKEWTLIGARDGALHVLNSTTARAKSTVLLSKNPLTSLALAANENYAAVGTENGEVLHVRLPSGELIARAKQSEEITGLHYLQPGLLVSASHDKTLRLWKVKDETLVEVLRLPCPGMVRRLKVTPDGRCWMILVAGEYGVRAWHLDSLLERLANLGLDGDIPAFIEARRPDAELPFSHEIPSGPGLVREDFYHKDFRRLTNTQVDALIHHNWRKSSPSLMVPGENYSVRWKGWLKAPRAGKYAIKLDADDGVRLWIEDRLLLDSWTEGVNKVQVEVELTAKPQRLRVDYFQKAQGAYCKLQWRPSASEADAKWEPIPSTAFFTTQEAASMRRPK